MSNDLLARRALRVHLRGTPTEPRNFTMITLFTALALLAAPAATTDPVSAPASVTVSYSDLNLRSAAGRAELDRRLDRAVRAVCPTADLRNLRAVQAADVCRTDAQAAANQQRDIALASLNNTVQIGSTGR
jgi:UrcA family protein